MKYEIPKYLYCDIYEGFLSFIWKEMTASYKKLFEANTITLLQLRIQISSLCISKGMDSSSSASSAACYASSHHLDSNIPRHSAFFSKLFNLMHYVFTSRLLLLYRRWGSTNLYIQVPTSLKVFYSLTQAN